MRFFAKLCGCGESDDSAEEKKPLNGDSLPNVVSEAAAVAPGTPQKQKEGDFPGKLPASPSVPIRQFVVPRGDGLGSSVPNSLPPAVLGRPPVPQ